MTTEKYCRSPVSLVPTTDPLARRPGCCRQERSSLKERPSLSYVFAGCERHCCKIVQIVDSNWEWLEMSPGVTFHSLFLADIRYSASHAATKKRPGPRLSHRGPCERDWARPSCRKGAMYWLCLLRTITGWPDAQGRQGGPAAWCRKCLAPASHREHPEPSSQAASFWMPGPDKTPFKPNGCFSF